METIYIDYGLHTAVTIDLSEFDFEGVEKVVLTAKKYMGDSLVTILVREYTLPNIYTEIITPEESKLFEGDVYYDFIAFMELGQVYRVSDVGKMMLRKGVGTVE